MAAQHDAPVPSPFTVHIPDEALERLQRKLRDYELPDKEIVPGSGATWDYGMSLDWLREMKTYWEAEFDWRAAEAQLNRWPQYTVDIEGLTLHFVHQKSTRADAIPLTIIHGWPGSYFEFHGIIQALVDPPDGQPAFHVVVPSVPGFAFSSTPQKTPWTVNDTARTIDTLMTRVLGYESYACQGGDWGSIISTLVSENARCKAVHLNMCTVPPPISPVLMGLAYIMPKWIQSRMIAWWFTPAEWAQMLRTKDFALQATGYFGMQSTQPFTIGLALNDSPVGLLAWIGEKYHSHLDPNFELPKATLLTTVALYYFTHTFASSCLPYRENTALFGAPPARVPSDTPLGVSIFAHDILVLPRSWVARWHRRALVFWRSHAKGGHFPALDNPDALVGDLREMMGKHHALFEPVPTS